ncbi:MAG: hypothetical protein COX96_02685 [Candidatus Omnitrophica bacterium CG_4_10_14_0_2_um_filter_44_9]|nr:MAG: hypothetical protein COY78_06255 [Candidatus Omnitrophica bacterium CG_4_10_14_0_8_um_filter_44_12]PIZ84695.1 MAG: hypothetical protein COX96_02685 [Candidatus Omnitrophica bacterium CG_4_10_14_0_2_um_filter_44_9]
MVFCLLFTKNEQDDLTQDEKKALKILSNVYDKLTEKEIEKIINRKTLAEVEYVKKT